MKNIAIVCGGYSGEYEISVKSGHNVKNNIDKSKYNAYVIVITKDKWTALLNDGTSCDVDRNDFSITENGKKIRFDAVFNAIHGTPGENGELPGYFDILGIPYTSSGMTTCALTFHKAFCKSIAEAHGATVSPAVMVRKGESYDTDGIIKQLGLPLFVKPNQNGSSVGVSKVKTREQFVPALERALENDTQAMCEAFVDGRELACGVMEVKGRMMVFPITEIVSKNEFFDYEAKYTSGKSDEITPAALDEDIELEIKAMSANLFYAFECKGFARFDYILSKTGLYFIEVNIVPGLSEASILPKQAACMGITLPKLFDLALENCF